MTAYELPERATAAYLSVRQEVRDFANEVEPGLKRACRIAIAEDYRRMADERMAEFETYRTTCAIPISHCRLCSTREHAACRAALDLRTRADALDPEGATR